MTYEQREHSMQDGQPAYLYEFDVYGTRYRYSSTGADYVFDSQTYFAVIGSLKHSDIELTTEVHKNDLKIECPNDFPILDFYEDAPPSDVIAVRVIRIHRGETDSAQEWYGRVTSAMRDTPGATLNCENVITSQKRTGLRRTYSRQCPHELFGGKCGVIEALFRIDAEVDLVLGRTIHAGEFAAFADDRFAGGVIEWEPIPGQKHRRAIKAHVGDTILITHPIAGLAPGQVIQALPGCNHDTDCEDFYDNGENFGGFRNVPRRNPMGGIRIF